MLRVAIKEGKWSLAEFTLFDVATGTEILPKQLIANGRYQFHECNSQRKTGVSEGNDCDHFHDEGFCLCFELCRKSVSGGEQHDTNGWEAKGRKSCTFEHRSQISDGNRIRTGMIHRCITAGKPMLAKILPLAGLCLPWLNPFAGGPSPAVLPWLVTLGCAALVLLGFGANGAVKPDTLALAWLVAAGLSSVMGLLQYFGEGANLSTWVNAAGLGEVYANLRQRNQFATLTNIGLAALLWRTTQSRLQQPRAVLGSTGMIGAATVLAAGNAGSSSRTGLLQLLLLGGLVWMWGGWRRPEIRRLMTVAIVAYVVAAVALPALLGLNPSETGMLGALENRGPGL